MDNISLIGLASIITAGLTIAIGSVGPALGEGRAVAQALAGQGRHPPVGIGGFGHVLGVIWTEGVDQSHSYAQVLPGPSHLQQEHLSPPLRIGSHPAGGFLQIITHRPPSQDLPATILKLMMAAFSFVLLGKIILNVRVWHYGFALAMPAALMVVTALWRWIPEWLVKYGGKRVVFQSVVLAVWLLAVAAHLKISGELFNHKQQIKILVLTLLIEYVMSNIICITRIL